MLKKILLFSLTTMVVFPALADGLVDDYSQNLGAYAPSEQSPLGRNYSISKSFYSIYQVATTLNKLGITTKVTNQQESSPTNITIKINTNIKDFINEAANKFGYSWSYIGGEVVFNALNPIKPKPIIIAPQKIESSVLVNTKNIVVIPVPASTTGVPTWTLNTNDRMLRNVLSKWSKQAGWQLIWTVKADYPITTSWVIHGSFESAVNQVLQATQSQDTPLFANMYDANKVLEIRSSAK